MGSGGIDILLVLILALLSPPAADVLSRAGQATASPSPGLQSGAQAEASDSYSDATNDEESAEMSLSPAIPIPAITWNSSLNRRFGKSMALNLGYRYFKDDYNNAPDYTWDVKQQGPAIGYTWAF